jgi:hypothetical protein
VVLACGGFEANPEMQRQHWQEKPVLNAAYMGNTGDGIVMAQDVGAALPASSRNTPDQQIGARRRRIKI